MAATRGRERDHAPLARGFEFSRLQDQRMTAAYALVVTPRQPFRRQPLPEQGRAADAPGPARGRRAGGQPA